MEPQTSFGARARRGETLIEPEERLLKIYRSISDRLTEANIPLYEVSNAAQAGEASRHNILYWTMGEYLGIGTGAHGRINLAHHETSDQIRAIRWQNIRSPKRYLTLSHSDLTERSLEEERGELNDEAFDEERVLVGLRLMKGLRVTDGLEHRYGKHARRLEQEGLLTISDLPQSIPAIRGVPRRMEKEDSLWWTPTPRGRELLDHVSYRLILG